jgi:putative Holliday junction resolvase
MAHPRPYLSAKKGLLAELGRIAEAEGIDHFLVGLPRNMDGSEGPGARRAREFAKLLTERTGRSVELVDERLSTVEAQARLHQQGLDIRRSRERIDSASAAILLQSWLDGRRRNE